MATPALCEALMKTTSWDLALKITAPNGQWLVMFESAPPPLPRSVFADDLFAVCLYESLRWSRGLVIAFVSPGLMLHSERTVLQAFADLKLQLPYPNVLGNEWDVGLFVKYALGDHSVVPTEGHPEHVYPVPSQIDWNDACIAREFEGGAAQAQEAAVRKLPGLVWSLGLSCRFCDTECNSDGCIWSKTCKHTGLKDVFVTEHPELALRYHRDALFAGGLYPRALRASCGFARKFGGFVPGTPSDALAFFHLGKAEALEVSKGYSLSGWTAMLCTVMPREISVILGSLARHFHKDISEMVLYFLLPSIPSIRYGNYVRPYSLITWDAELR